MIPFSLNPLGVNKTTEISDLDILKQIRDANPTSKLPNMWLDSEDPYTQWEGVYWNTNKTKVDILDLFNLGIVDVSSLNKLKYLRSFELGSNQITSLNIDGMITLTDVNASFNKITSFILPSGLQVASLYLSGNLINELTLPYDYSNLNSLLLSQNKLTSIPTLTSKSNISYYSFTYNNLSTSETNRIIGLGFNSRYVLPQNP